jgi:hypothetical protein
MPIIYDIDLLITNINYRQKRNSLKPKIKTKGKSIPVTGHGGP